MRTRFRWRLCGGQLPALRARHAACALGLAVIACQGMNEPTEPSIVDAQHSFIRFQHPDFDADLSEYTVERERRTGNELHVARLYGADTFAILVAYKTSASYVVRERSTESYIANMFDWDVDWGESGRTTSGFGPVPYRLFQVAGQPLSCVGFGQTVGDTSDDRGRKSDMITGFFCHDESRPMTTDAAEDLIGKVSLAGRR